MQHSSLGLATALVFTFASAGSASAAFHPAHGFGPVHHMGFAHHFGPFAAFRRREAHIFHHGRDRQGLFFSAGYQDPAGAPAPQAESSGPGSDAPIINVTIAPPFTGEAYSRPQAYADNFGPKIIVIGGHTRPAHAKKMPVVIYGTHPDQAY
jgi:hypothetical protein